MFKDGRIHGRPTKYRPEYDEQVIAMGKEGYNHYMMASKFNVAISTLYHWGLKNPSFSEAFTRAIEHSAANFSEKLLNNMSNDKYNAKLSEIVAKFVLNLSTSRKYKHREELNAESIMRLVESGEFSAKEGNELSDLWLKKSQAKKNSESSVKARMELGGCSTVKEKIGLLLKLQETGKIASHEAKALMENYRLAAQVEEQDELKMMVYELQQKLEES